MPVSPIASSIFGTNVDIVESYVDLLLSLGIDRGLIGPREADRIWDRHIFNSAALTGLVPEGAEVVDVGSGAGLPGLPLALARPDVRVTLLEPLLRRSAFLDEVVAELGVSDRVRVVRSRAEDHRSFYDVVTARAVAPLHRLLTWCAPLIATDGSLLALKGSSAEREVAEAATVLRERRLTAEVLEVRAHPDTEPTRVVRIR